MGIVVGILAFNPVRLLSGNDPNAALTLLGWLLLVGGPIAALDAWGAGLISGQKVLPWVRLVGLAGGGIVGGAYLVLVR